MITKQYKEQLTELHKRKDWGTSAVYHKALVEDCIREVSASSVLDYGCGKGVLKEEFKDLQWCNYDPITNPDTKDISDLVICLDVLEHVEEDFVDDVLTDINNHSKSGVLLFISLIPAQSTLPNGENAHITLKPVDWWKEKIDNNIDGKKKYKPKVTKYDKKIKEISLTVFITK